MDKKILKEHITNMLSAIKMMEDNLDDASVLKFYAGEVSVLNKAVMAMLVKAN
ncbi:MAG: hypothetical protein K6A44_08240 [bacterium]|nr:hypothetical protein [bacterium]